MGQGFDRHLMGLRVTADRLGRPAAPMFSGSVYAFANQYVLSTSTLSTPSVFFGGCIG
jgi:carnitine O-palmitoyltransferase 2